jgi:MOSC domain-containing protein YiiM
LAISLEYVATGAARPWMVGGRRIVSAYGKQAVAGPVLASALGLAGDEQADLAVHGGLAKAIYAYPLEHWPLWEQARAHAGISPMEPHLPPGFLGENLGIRGLLEADAFIGDELHFPHAVLRITAPREPCFKFTHAMGWGGAARVMVEHAACGFYCAVAQAGPLQAGDTAQRVAGQGGLSVRDAFLAKKAKHLR